MVLLMLTLSASLMNCEFAFNTLINAPIDDVFNSFLSFGNLIQVKTIETVNQLKY